MKKSLTYYLTTAAILLAMAVLLPMFFHMFGAGNQFLPMHIPALLAGFMLPAPYAVLCGALMPALSSMLTGMPVVFPMLPLMVVELAVYALCASIFYRKLGWNVYLALLGAMGVGRIAAGVMSYLLVGLFAAQFPAVGIAYIGQIIVTGVIGIVIQIVVLPPLVLLLKKGGLLNTGLNGARGAR
ncbi:MAG: ECF transporter S component [Christensenellales bacterium]|jgi:hypothetical protein